MMPKFISITVISLSAFQTHVYNLLLHIPTWISDRQLKFYMFKIELLIQSLPL